MNAETRERLESAGFVETTVEELFGLTPEEAKHIQDKLADLSTRTLTTIENRRKLPPTDYDE